MWRNWWYGVVTDHIGTLELKIVFRRVFYVIGCQLILKRFEDTYHEANSCEEQEF